MNASHLPRRPVLAALLGLGLLGATVASGLCASAQSRPVPRPETSALAAEEAPVASRTRIRAEGRLVAYPGAEVALSSELGGTIVRLPVEEKAVVRAGDLVCELDSSELRAALAEAEGRIAEAEAGIRFGELEVVRFAKLRGQDAASQQSVERAEHDLAAARARRAQAEGAARRIEAQIRKQRIVAPIGGAVLSRPVQPGETLVPGARVATIADLGRTRIAAEVDEFDAGGLRLGAPVTVHVEGWSGSTWRGHVEEIPDAVIGRQLKPQDPGRPSDTRIVLAKVALDEPTPLKLGQRVELEIR